MPNFKLNLSGADVQKYLYEGHNAKNTADSLKDRVDILEPTVQLAIDNANESMRLAINSGEKADEAVNQADVASGTANMAMAHIEEVSQELETIKLGHTQIVTAPVVVNVDTTVYIYDGSTGGQVLLPQTREYSTLVIKNISASSIIIRSTASRIYPVNSNQMVATLTVNAGEVVKFYCSPESDGTTINYFQI